MDSPPRQEHTDKMRRLIFDMSTLNTQLSEFRRLTDELSKEFIANINKPDSQHEIVARLNSAFVAVRIYLLEQLILDECLTLYEAGNCSQSQYQLTTELIHRMGAIEFVQKILWSERVEDVGLSISLHEIIPTLEQFVQDYPHLFLDHAREVILKIKCRN